MARAYKMFSFPTPSFGSRCVLCQSSHLLFTSQLKMGLCASCLSLSWSPERTLLNTDPPLSNYTLFCSHSPLYSLIKTAKNRSEMYLFLHIIQGCSPLIEPIREWISLSSEPFIFVPICSRKDHFKQRGFNPAHLFALSLHKTLPSTFLHAALTRSGPSLPQVSLNRTQRLIAQKNTLKAHPILNQMRVCLVDDITTTGGTLIEAQRACLEIGVKECYAVSLFRG